MRILGKILWRSDTSNRCHKGNVSDYLLLPTKSKMLQSAKIEQRCILWHALLFFFYISLQQISHNCQSSAYKALLNGVVWHFVDKPTSFTSQYTLNRRLFLCVSLQHLCATREGKLFTNQSCLVSLIHSN